MSAVRDLARDPEEEAFLPFSRPSITEREKLAVLEVLDSGWLSVGPQTKQFEAEFARFVGSPHALALNSATAGLHLALEALGVGPGDEVIVPTWTFASSAEVVVWLGARPVFVDVDPLTLNAMPDAILAAVTDRTRAVVAVHVAGDPGPVVAVCEALDRLGIPVVEDAAHAFPSVLPDGRYAGTVGRVGVYSFYATKTITTGEGGMLVTGDQAIADRARLMSLHGISRTAWNRYSSAGTWAYDIEDAGFKYNMTDIAAAIGRVQLSRARALLHQRRDLVALYRATFARSTIGSLVQLPVDPGPQHAWHLFIVRLALDLLRIDRRTVVERLRERNIGSSVHFIPLHQHPYYRDTWGVDGSAFPNANREFERAISLPLWPGMRESDVGRVVRTLAEILDSDRR